MFLEAFERFIEKRGKLPFAIIAIIIIIVYGQAAFFEFVSWDDGFHIYDNDNVKDVVGSLKSIFSFFQKPQELPLSFFLWSVLGKLSSLFPSELSKEGFNPFLYHAFNLLLHLANGALVYSILRKLIKPLIPCLLGALLFALHPLQVEPVVWVSGMKELLSSTFVLCIIYLLLPTRSTGDNVSQPRGKIASASKGLSRQERRLQEKKARKKNREITPPENAPLAQMGVPGKNDNVKTQILLSTLFLLGILTKPTALVAFPIVVTLLLLIDRKSVRQFSPMLILWAVIGGYFALITKQIQSDSDIGEIPSVVSRFFVAGDAIAFYIYKTVMPTNLTIDYGRTPFTVLQSKVAFLTSVPALLLVLYVFFNRKVPSVIKEAFLLLLLPLTPVLGFIPFLFQNHSTVADRYMYLSMLGVSLASAYGLSRLRTKGLWVAASFIVVLGILSFWQTKHWNDGMALYQHALAANPESDMAYHNLGRTLADKKKYKEAIQYYKKSLQLDPDYVGAYHSLGKAQFELGQQSEGIVNMLQAVNLKPDYADGHYDLANAYQEIDSSQKAIFHYRRVLAVEPENHRAYNNMGNTLVASQDTSSAIRCYKKAIELSPRYSGYVINLARLNEDTRKQISTQVASAESLNDAGKLNDLGVYYATNQNLSKAIECFEKALRVDSTNVDALSNLANASMISGDFEKAIELYDRSIELDSTKDNAYYNKGVALHRQNRISEAIVWYQKALEVNQGNRKAREVLKNLGIQ